MSTSDEKSTAEPLSAVTTANVMAGPSSAAPGSALVSMLLRLLRPASGLAVLAIVPLFLVFANTQIKELSDRFLGGCVLVIEKHLASSGQILITGRIAGTMPKSRGALINTILFDEAYRQQQISEPDDLAFHPMTGSQCPGSLCEESGSAVVRSQAQVMLRDLRAEFTYRFRVRMQPSSGSESVELHQLKVYALFDKGIADGVCRVQPRRWFNFWVWASPLKKAILFVTIVVAGGLMLIWAKPTGN
jgi:hypothetical protein